MEKTIVRFEELVIAGILRFEELSQKDIELLKEWLLDNYHLEVKGNSIILNSEYIAEQDGNYFLNPEFTLDSNVSFEKENSFFPLEKRLEFSQGLTLSKCFEELDLYDFVLKKIKALTPLYKSCLKNNFSKKQLELIDDLELMGFIVGAWTDSYVNDSEIKLTDSGESKLFIDQNKPIIEEFYNNILALGYNPDLLWHYLKDKDINQSLTSILNLEAFLEAYPMDKPLPTPVEEVSNQLNYLTLPIDCLRDRKSLIHQMLNITEDHVLYICHPNSLFVDKKEFNKEEPAEIEWENIDFAAMHKYYDYKSYDVGINYRAIKYLCNLSDEVKKNGGFSKYVVVFERYTIDDFDNFLVRGIIKISKTTCSICLNPEFEEFILLGSTLNCSYDQSNIYRLRA